MIGQQDESQIMQQPPNLGLGQQQARSVNGPGPAAQAELGETGGAEPARNVPSELRSRPKIPRTPAEGEGRQKGD